MNAKPPDVVRHGGFVVGRLHRFETGGSAIPLRQTRHFAVVGPLPVEWNVVTPFRSQEDEFPLDRMWQHVHCSHLNNPGLPRVARDTWPWPGTCACLQAAPGPLPWGRPAP